MTRTIVFIGMFLLLIVSGCDKYKRSYFVSPNEDKTITFIEHPNNPYHFYVIPGRWDVDELPKDNYVMVSWSDVRSFEVNWLTKKFRIAYPNVVENRLDTSQVDFSWHLYDNEVIVKDKIKWRKSPHVEGYILRDIFSGDYLRQRQEE